MDIKMGQKVRDSITGFEGTVTGRTEYINGCVQFCVSPGVDKDGKMAESHWIDWQRLAVVGGAEVVPIAASGGPQANAPSTTYRA